MSTAQLDGGQTMPQLEPWTTASVGSDLGPAELDVVFRRQPKPVPARLRLAYRTGVLVLVLSQFNRGAASVINLHTVVWALRTARTRQMFRAWWDGRRFSFSSTSRIDPDLQVTLNLALVDGLIVSRREGARVELLEKGWDLANRIAAVDDLLVVEKDFLQGLERLSDASMDRRLTGGVS